MAFDEFSRAGLILGASLPKNLDEAIPRFLSALELSDPQTELVAARQNALRDRVTQSAPFSILKTPLYGSYERSTQIKPRPTDQWVLDVDALVIVDASKKNVDKYFYNRDGGYLLLEDLRKSVAGFQGLKVELDAPAVSVKWESNKMKVELTPAFHRTDGGLLIPGSLQFLYMSDWQVSNPIGDAEALTKGNKACSGALKPLIKAAKCWNRKEDKILSSYALECVMFSSAVPGYRDFKFELRWFFVKLLELDGKTVPPPSGIGASVKINLGWNKYKVENALSGIEKAYALESQGRHRDAILEMAKVFGSPFPLAQSPAIQNPWSLL